MKKLILLLALFQLLLLNETNASSSEMKVCNSTPLDLYMVVAYDKGDGYRTKGWYHFEPGKCMSFYASLNSTFFYYAHARNALARWLSDGNNLYWEGNSEICIGGNEAFDYPSSTDCSRTAKFYSKKVSSNFQTVTLTHSYYRGIPLNELQEVQIGLTHLMDYENLLLNNSVREARFQIGVDLIMSGNSVKISYVYPGMPAETAGLEPGDIITDFNGYLVQEPYDLTLLLDNIPLTTTDPIPLSVIRDGERIEGSIVPMFFEFNHPDYNDFNRITTFSWSFFDGITFGFLNEIGCGLLHGAEEWGRAHESGKEFNDKEFSRKYNSCAERMNEELLESEILFDKASTAAFWSSMIVPVGGAAKGVSKLSRLKNSVPLAARSRFVKNLKQSPSPFRR